MNKEKVGLIGATSLVGKVLIPILEKANFCTYAFSRHEPIVPSTSDLVWKKIDIEDLSSVSNDKTISSWIYLAPIWTIPAYFKMLESYEAKRVVVLSSTSRFSKEKSSDLAEKNLAMQLINGEHKLRSWAESRGIEWIVLRPTLIYGGGYDKNITEIARIIRRFGFFPVLGKAEGLRQPIRAEDVAQACFLALKTSEVTNKCYNISGSEILSYRNMIQRVFLALGKTPRVLTVPLLFFNFAVIILRLLPKYRKWTAAMAERMNSDLNFDHRAATEDFSFEPRPFFLDKSDLNNF